jgi:hypothetical protein
MAARVATKDVRLTSRNEQQKEHWLVENFN